MFVQFPHLDAPPSLSAAFADYRTHDLLAVLSGSGEPHPGELVTVDGLEPAGSGFDDERIVRRHRVGKAGVILTVIGYPVAAIGAVTTLVGALGDSSDTVVGGFVLVIGGTGMAIAGPIMLFTGGIGAANLLGESTKVGWVGVGLLVGAFPFSVLTSGIGNGEVAVLGGLGIALGGLVCGAVQLGQAGSAGRRAGAISVHMLPDPRGLRLVGTF